MICPLHVDGALSDYDDHDGSTWALAFETVQEGINAAAEAAAASAAPCAVWVAAGTYAPTEDQWGSTSTSSARWLTFSLKEGVELYGGFAGDETSLDQRDVAANETILTGNVSDPVELSDGGVGEDDVSDNAYHVVRGADGALIDGFTITGGNASGSSWYENGGGMYNDNSSPTVTDCTFSGNTAAGDGGGMGAGDGVVRGCTFENNTAEDGGGIAGAESVVNCVFTDNSAIFSGGGIATTSIAVANCTFSGNTAVTGGGMSCGSLGTGVVVDVESSVFWGNTASGLGDEGGGGINFDGGFGHVRNCVVWGNGSQVAGPSAALFALNVTYSDVEGGWTGAGDFEEEPLFVDAEGGDFHLQAGSPCIDMGTSYYLPADTADLDEDDNVTEDIPLDPDGNPRVVGEEVDVGAYEYQVLGPDAGL